MDPMDIVGKSKEDVSLPKSTMFKIIKEMLPPDVRVARDAQDLLVECCVEFINLLSSESNEVCSREEKKTIAPEHVIKALSDLGFREYIEEVYAAYEQHKLDTLMTEEEACDCSCLVANNVKPLVTDDVLTFPNHQIVTNASAGLIYVGLMMHDNMMMNSKENLKVCDKFVNWNPRPVEENVFMRFPYGGILGLVVLLSGQWVFWEETFGSFIEENFLVYTVISFYWLVTSVVNADWSGHDYSCHYHILHK
ncbi:hypothetical protein ACJX0J_008934 [Zea mays]